MVALEAEASRAFMQRNLLPSLDFAVHNEASASEAGRVAA